MTDDTSPWALAACADEWETFDAADSGDRDAIREALALCHSCPVIADCLASTLAFEKAHGGEWVNFIAGGMLPAARAKLLGKHLRHHDRHAKKATT